MVHIRFTFGSMHPDGPMNLAVAMIAGARIREIRRRWHGRAFLPTVDAKWILHEIRVTKVGFP